MSKEELSETSNKKNLFQRIQWGIFLPILFTLIGGAFFFGKYIGENKFDNEKNTLYQSNKSLESENDSLRKVIKTQKKEIKDVLDKELTETKNDNENISKVSVSYMKPKTIYDGQIMIQAKKEINSILVKFTGVEGISKTEQGDYNLKELNVNAGDRFFIKSNVLIQDGVKVIGVNVLNTTIDLELEMFPTIL